MSGFLIDQFDLLHYARCWPFLVTLGVLVLAGQACRILGRESASSSFVSKSSEVLLLSSAAWGVYLLIDLVIFIFIDWGWKALPGNAGMIVIFKAVVELTTGLWLAAVGISRIVHRFKAGGDAAPAFARTGRAERAAEILASAWLVCFCILFSRMHLYVYLSTLGLLILGFFAAARAAGMLRGGEGRGARAHVLVRIAGALSLSLGVFAFIGVFYRAAFGESWPIVWRQLLTALSFGGIGVLLLARTGPRHKAWLVCQLALSVVAIGVVTWRVADSVYKVPAFADHLRYLVRSAESGGCGRYVRHLHCQYDTTSLGVWSSMKPLDVVGLKKGLYDYDAVPDCESIPTEIQVARDGVLLGDAVSPGGDPALESLPGFVTLLKEGMSTGLVLVVERDVSWKMVTDVVEIVRKNGNHRLSFLFLDLSEPPPDGLDDHRLGPKIEDIVRRDAGLDRNLLHCGKILDRIDAFCPQVQTLFAAVIEYDQFDILEAYAHDMPWAAAACFADVDLEALELLLRCIFRFKLVCVVDVLLAGPEAPWSRTIALPADLPWSRAHKHLLKAISGDQKPIPPIRMVVEPHDGSR